MRHTIDAYRDSDTYTVLSNAFFDGLPVTTVVRGKTVTGVITETVLWEYDRLLGKLWRFTLEEARP